MTTDISGVVKDKNETSNKNIKPLTSWNTMNSVDMVLKIAEDYINKTGRRRGVNPYIKTRLPEDKNISMEYIRVLRSYGGRLKKEGLYEEAMQNDWTFVRIIEEIKKAEEKRMIEQKMIIEERRRKKALIEQSGNK